MRPTCPLDAVHPRRRPPCVRLDCLTDAADAADASLISTMLDDSYDMFRFTFLDWNILGRSDLT